MSPRTPILTLTLALAGCFHPVDECRGIHCPKDAGHAVDAGADAGPDNDDDDCPETDPSLTIPCTSSQEGDRGVIFDGQACSVRCLADPVPPGVAVYGSLRQCAFRCAYDSCQKQKLAASVSSSASCGALRVTTSDAREVIESFALAITGDDGGYGCNPATGECVVLTEKTLGDAGYHEACAATLLPSTTLVSCDGEAMP
jgi:hypothetical protein